MKTVRTAVKDHLTTNCPSFSGGFFEPYIADKTTTKPFGVVKVAGDDGAYQGGVKTLQIMCHSARDTWDTLDALVLSVIKALDRVRISCGTIGTKTFYITPHYVGTMGDWADDDRETIVRTCEFEVVIAR